MEKARSWCGQPSDRGRLQNRTEQSLKYFHYFAYVAEAKKESTTEPKAPFWAT